MRIIAGKFRGRKLLDEFDKNIVRPTQDRVRESVCNSLSREILNSSVLDLFCGTGSYGLESLSRGATSCVFVDNDKDSLGLSKKNLEKINIEKIVFDVSFVQMGYESFLKSTTKKFDVIFADAPYELGKDAGVLKNILESGVIAKGGALVYETTMSPDKSKRQTEETFVKELDDKVGLKGFEFKTKNFGNKNVILVRNLNE